MTGNESRDNGPVQQIGRILALFGGLILVVGVAVMAMGKLGLGHLPGDIVIRRKNFSLYVPVVTCIVISILLSLILWLFGKR
jgi:Protein of unknown function (DUF2905)